MRNHLLHRLSAIILLLISLWPLLSAQTTETPASIVSVNGHVVERKVVEIYLTTTSDNGLRYNYTAPRVALVYEKDTLSTGPTIDYIHPFVCRVLFGDAVTGVRDIHLYEISKLEGEDLHLQGLAEGQLVQVYNTSGRLCLTTRASSNGAIVGLRNLPKDIYIIKAGQTAFKYINRKK